MKIAIIVMIVMSIVVNVFAFFLEKSYKKKVKKEEKKAERRKKFGYEEKSRVGSYRRPHHVFRFNDVDVDNDDIISMVEQTPTAHRSSAMLRRIYEKNYGGSAPEKQNGDAEQTTDPSTIKF